MALYAIDSLAEHVDDLTCNYCLGKAARREASNAIYPKTVDPFDGFASPLLSSCREEVRCRFPRQGEHRDLR